eukprot:15482411-Alexandrium_andersonii.AAC.1
MVPNAEAGPNDVVVDPAGLRFARGNRPWGAGGASRATYEYYGIDADFPRGPRDELKEVSDASLKSTGCSVWSI